MVEPEIRVGCQLQLEKTGRDGRSAQTALDQGRDEMLGDMAALRRAGDVEELAHDDAVGAGRATGPRASNASAGPAPPGSASRAGYGRWPACAPPRSRRRRWPVTPRGSRDPAPLAPRISPVKASPLAKRDRAHRIVEQGRRQAGGTQRRLDRPTMRQHPAQEWNDRGPSDEGNRLRHRVASPCSGPGYRRSAPPHHGAQRETRPIRIGYSRCNVHPVTAWSQGVTRPTGRGGATR